LSGEREDGDMDVLNERPRRATRRAILVSAALGALLGLVVGLVVIQLNDIAIEMEWVLATGVSMFGALTGAAIEWETHLDVDDESVERADPAAGHAPTP
jgi:hypothetical protein